MDVSLVAEGYKHASLIIANCEESGKDAETKSGKKSKKIPFSKRCVLEWTHPKLLHKVQMISIFDQFC